MQFPSYVASCRDQNHLFNSIKDAMFQSSDTSIMHCGGILTMSTYYLGIDAGTTKIKAGLVDQNGRLVGLASCPVQIKQAHRGWSEIDMMELWQKLAALLNQLSLQHPDKISQIAAIGVAGQGDGYWPIDVAGKPVGPSILWNDTRAKALNCCPMKALQEYVEITLSPHYFQDQCQ